MVHDSIIGLVECVPDIRVWTRRSFWLVLLACSSDVVHHLYLGFGRLSRASESSYNSGTCTQYFTDFFCPIANWANCNRDIRVFRCR